MPSWLDDLVPMKVVVFIMWSVSMASSSFLVSLVSLCGKECVIAAAG